jgi:hypothetical protein
VYASPPPAPAVCAQFTSKSCEQDSSVPPLKFTGCCATALYCRRSQEVKWHWSQLTSSCSATPSVAYGACCTSC